MSPMKASQPAFGREPQSRRDFLAWMAATTALLSMEGCFRQPLQLMVPYAKMPEGVIPGRPLFYASAFPLDGYGTGILVESHLGRPTKIEGNGLHPASLGATDAFAQAAILGLYDPDRAQAVLHEGRLASWEAFTKALGDILVRAHSRRGEGLRLLTPTTTSPTLGDQIRRVLAALPGARWHRHQPIACDNARRGMELAFGEILHPRYDFRQADVIVSFDHDFLTVGPGRLRHARDFSDRRRLLVGEGGADVNRLYVLESAPSLTGAVADHRRAVDPGKLFDMFLALAQALGVTVAATPDLEAADKHWVDVLAEDLQAHRGRSLVVVGESLPPIAHALQHRLNQALGNLGKTSFFTAPVEMDPVDQSASVQALVEDMRHGKVESLLILGGNPVYTTPEELGFGDALSKVNFRAHLSVYRDETSERCQWHIPETHFLESWGDVRADDGTVSIMQPLIEPLFQGRSPHELLAVLLGTPANSYDAVRQYWESRAGGIDFATRWQKWLHDGMIADSALPRHTPTLRADPVLFNVVSSTHVPSRLHVVLRPDPTIWDGQFANNGWLQELPKPLIEITWGNVALIHPRTAAAAQLAAGDEIAIKRGDHQVTAPVWLHPLQAENVVTLTLGYGRARAGRLGSKLGYNAYALRTAAAPWVVPIDSMTKTGKRVELATTQGHQTMAGRDLVRLGTMIEYQKDPAFFSREPDEGRPYQPLVPVHAPDVPPQPEAAEQWGMTINLNTCIGCNACIVACQAENNIPVVGKDQVMRNREMHWLRVDHYFEGPADHPEVLLQPVPCMHCETAPCELVCPVAATAHSHDGLNQMVYNRCVGTRYCSNNCPYRVRRFNFYNYSDPRPLIKMLRNPDVTVRTRGVMEKCTYCIQRIQEGRIEAEKAGRPIADGEIKTACQQVCPTRTIVFGNIKDPNSEVSRHKADPRNYSILAELNTRPRTSYLARIKNPNPAMKEASS